MTIEQLKAFETWLMGVYQENPNIDFHVLALALKAVRVQAK